MKYLILKGSAGLGNRLITLMKAIEYSKKTDRTLFVDWDDGMFANKGENAFFSFFELRNINYITDKSKILQVYLENGTTYPFDLQYDDISCNSLERFRLVTPLVSKFIPYRYFVNFMFRGKMTYIFGGQSIQRENNGVVSYMDVIKNIYKGDNIPMGGVISLNRQEDLILFCDTRPIVNISNLSNYVVLREDLSLLIEEYATKHNVGEAIGVHVRYTDKKPMFFLSKLYKKIDKQICTNPSQRIFLCTDNIDIVDSFKERYGDNVFQTDKYLPQTSGKGLHNYARANLDNQTKNRMAIECIMDMWLLSKCKILYWQGNSSFSYISKVLKNDAKSTFNWMSIW